MWTTAGLTARLTPRFGPDVAAWCSRAPDLAARLAREWGVALGEAHEGGGSSLAIRCTTADGRPAVLKLSPDGPFLLRQAGMLRSLAPSGRVPEVLEVGEEAVLLEAVEPGAEADAAPEEWAGLMADLHAVEPPATLARTLRGRWEESFARIGRRLAEPAVAARLDRAAWDRAIERCGKLLDSQRTTVLLHGDLHPGNVLDGGARGLVAIDPKTCVGDPCFDAVDYVLGAAGGEGVEVRCERVARAYGLDPERLFEWCRVDAPMVAIGLLTWGGSEEALEQLLALV